MKGKGGGKGKSKDGKGRGKGNMGSKGMGKGKGSGKAFKGAFQSPKGHSRPGLQLPMAAGSSSINTTTAASTADITCYFCHQKGHYKSQCPKWLALRSSSSYQQTRQQAPRLGLILDHLEDSVFAPSSACMVLQRVLCWDRLHFRIRPS